MQHTAAIVLEFDSLNDLQARNYKYLVIHKTGKSCGSEKPLRLWNATLKPSSIAMKQPHVSSNGSLAETLSKTDPFLAQSVGTNTEM